MLNEYLNKYAEKLSRGSAFNPFEIKVDYEKYDDILSALESQTYNPYFIYLDRKEEQMRGEGEGASRLSMDKAKSKFMDHFVNEKEEFRK